MPDCLIQCVWQDRWFERGVQKAIWERVEHQALNKGSLCFQMSHAWDEAIRRLPNHLSHDQSWRLVYIQIISQCKRHSLTLWKHQSMYLALDSPPLAHIPGIPWWPPSHLPGSRLPQGQMRSGLVLGRTLSGIEVVEQLQLPPGGHHLH